MPQTAWSAHIQLSHRPTTIRCRMKLVPGRLVPSLCFIQSLGSSDTMKKTYGMVTALLFLPNYENSWAARTTCHRWAGYSPGASPLCSRSRSEKVANFTFTVMAEVAFIFIWACICFYVATSLVNNFINAGCFGQLSSNWIYLLICILKRSFPNCILH